MSSPPTLTLFPYTTLFRSGLLPEKDGMGGSSVNCVLCPVYWRSTGRRNKGIRRPVDLQYTGQDRKSTRLNSSHSQISYAVFCLKKKKRAETATRPEL